MATLLELWSEWELHVLVLLSFMLQVFLFFSGGLRRRITNIILRLLLWLAYLIADFIAVYSLGLLSRQKTNAAGVDEDHQLMFLWTPFLLIHLGGQDTITAFSVEDNELWLRHLLNLLVQVGLALYILWKSISHNPFAASTVFAFIAGIIKYGERTWALKCASKEGLRNTTGEKVCPFAGIEEDEQQLGLSTLVRFSLGSFQGVMDLFVGRKVKQMEGTVQTAFAGGFYRKISRNGEVVFKILEIELGMMYDTLYTKARLFCTWAGSILRLVTFVCLLVAFVLFLTEKKKLHHTYSRADVAITYTLFVGAFCLDVCSIFLVVMMSPWTWAFLRSWKCHRLSRETWYVFKCAQPAGCSLSWSNSMGQYNFLTSCFSDNVIGKMMNLFGVKEQWRNFRHTRFVDVNTAIKKIIFEDKYLDEILSSTGEDGLFPFDIKSKSSSVFRAIHTILEKPLGEAIISLHIYTEIFLNRCMYPIEAGASTSSSAGSGGCQQDKADEGQLYDLISTCRALSEYMCYLLAVHPDMLPITGSAGVVLDKASDTVVSISGISRSAGSNSNRAKDVFLERLMKIAAGEDIYRQLNGNPNPVTLDPVTLAGFAFLFMTDQTVQRNPLGSLRHLVRAWSMVLIYAASKSLGEVNARHLSMGGELLSFIWLHLAHHSYGDMGTIELEFHPPPPLEMGGRKIYILEPEYRRRELEREISSRRRRREWESAQERNN